MSSTPWRIPPGVGLKSYSRGGGPYLGVGREGSKADQGGGGGPPRANWGELPGRVFWVNIALLLDSFAHFGNYLLIFSRMAHFSSIWAPGRPRLRKMGTGTLGPGISQSHKENVSYFNKDLEGPQNTEKGPGPPPHRGPRPGGEGGGPPPRSREGFSPGESFLSKYCILSRLVCSLLELFAYFFPDLPPDP